MGIIIDTSAIVELERSRESWEKISEAVGGQAAFLTTIVWGELLVGVQLADSVERALRRKAKLDQLRKNIAVLPFTIAVAEVWAELFAVLRRTGKTVPANDLSVASTAIHHGHQVLVGSRDEEHFRRIPGLSVIKL